MAGIATLQEVETVWSLEDLLMANFALTYSHEQQADAERRAYERAGGGK